MQSGLLTGSFDKQKLEPTDWRITHSEKFHEPKFSRGLRVVEAVRPIAAKYGKTVGQLAIAWVLSHPAVTCAIPGMTRITHLEDNAAGGKGRMPDAAMRKRMQEFWASLS
jgi:aryl-alcohol dehydrogenase-like predicted oxidoreductase